MKNEQALTIDPVATKRRVKADGRTPAAWARIRGIASGTAQRVFAGSYPHNDDPESEYQKVLKRLKADGYLVEATEVEQTRAA